MKPGTIFKHEDHLHKVISYCEKPPTKGEMSCDFSYDKPFPQVYVLRDDGNTGRFDGFDVSTVEIVENSDFGPKSLAEYLSVIQVDDTPAAYDLGDESGGSIQSLYECLPEILKSIISPLCNQEVYYSGPTEVQLGEFDQEWFTFRSAAIGRMMRNDGSPAFVLKISVDGYAPPCIDLHTTEVLIWK